MLSARWRLPFTPQLKTEVPACGMPAAVAPWSRLTPGTGALRSPGTAWKGMACPLLTCVVVLSVGVIRAFVPPGVQLPCVSPVKIPTSAVCTKGLLLISGSSFAGRVLGSAG